MVVGTDEREHFWKKSDSWPEEKIMADKVRCQPSWHGDERQIERQVLTS